MDERWPRSVGGHVVLDFVNTDVFSQGDRATDVLRSAAELLAWCASAGLAAPRAPGRHASSLLADAAALRTAVRRVVEAVAERRPPDAEALADIRSACADAVGHARPVMEGGRLVWTWDASDPHTVVWQLATGAADLLRDGPTDRIKLCPGCGFAFLDTTKNGGRRWCSMEDCGKQEKMRRYVTKRAASRKATQPGA